MIWRNLRAVLGLVILVACFAYPVRSQTTTSAQTPPGQSTYTFQADTRVVLTDVTVTDKNGNPVDGLPEADFRIFDNKQPQTIASFEEHKSLPPAPALTTEGVSGVYSNEYLLHLPPVLNIVLIDISNLEMPDQMYLNYELTKFLKEWPGDQPLAIYLRAGDGCFLVQNFTSDRKLLLDAVHKAIPRFPPAGREFLSDFDALQQIAVPLRELPGRKNVLWFSGGAVLSLFSDPFYLRNEATWRDLYDQLDQERIAIYPIDARGLMVLLKRRDQNDVWSQHVTMDDTAQATGGQAFYNNNGLKEATEHFLDSDSSFYTLTYAPHDFRFDNKWHKVRVEVAGGAYHLSYRSGYFADGSLRGKEQPAKSRTKLLVNGEKREVTELSIRPIIFQASLHPASDPVIADMEKPSGSLPAPAAKKGSVPFLIRYTVPMDAFTLENIEGRHQVRFGVAVIVMDRDGGVVERNAQKVTMVFKEEALRRSPVLPIMLDQQLNLVKKDQYLYLAIWDMTSGSVGTLDISLDVQKPQKHAEKAASH